MPPIQNIHVHVMLETVSHFCQYTGLMVSSLLLLPQCMAITGYQISSTNSNSQQQPTAGCRQTSKSLPSTSPPTRVKITTDTIYALQFKYTNTMPTVLCMNNGLVHNYIAGSDLRYSAFCVSRITAIKLLDMILYHDTKGN